MSKGNIIFITFVYILGLQIICAQNTNNGQTFKANTEVPMDVVINQENNVVPSKLSITTDSNAVSSLKTTTISNIVVPPPSSTKSIAVAVEQVSKSPTTGSWNSTCLMIQMAAQLNITYETKDNNTNSTLYNLPSNATSIDGTCENETQQLVLEWGPPEYISSLTVEFRHDAVKKEFSIFELLFKIQTDDKELFPEAKDNQTIQLVHFGNIFKTPVGMSYQCKKEQKFNLTHTKTEKVVVGTLLLQDVRYEAFHTGNMTKFSTGKDCDEFDTPDIVPVAVGCALVFLIIVILISYLVARRRSTARGYMSF